MTLMRVFIGNGTKLAGHMRHCLHYMVRLNLAFYTSREGCLLFVLVRCEVFVFSCSSMYVCIFLLMNISAVVSIRPLETTAGDFLEVNRAENSRSFWPTRCM